MLNGRVYEGGRREEAAAQHAIEETMVSSGFYRLVIPLNGGSETRAGVREYWRAYVSRRPWFRIEEYGFQVVIRASE